MKLPRNLSGDELVKKLRKLGYKPTREIGSHIRITNTGKRRTSYNHTCTQTFKGRYVVSCP